MQRKRNKENVKREMGKEGDNRSPVQLFFMWTTVKKAMSFARHARDKKSVFVGVRTSGSGSELSFSK